MSKPTESEILALAVETGMRVRTGKGAINFARAVLAKWGTQPVACEPLTDGMQPASKEQTMTEPVLICPECGSDRVTTEYHQMFMVNGGDHYCHLVKPQDVDSPATCLVCLWEGERGNLKSKEKHMNEDIWGSIDCNKALDALIDAYHFKSESGKDYLINFIRDVELIKRSQIKQVPALFKKEN